ncbi:alpha-aminoadipic semialdehyde synthase, mitochondrial-like [Anopheles albimanus]|uniref:alpha-aminoadipic semialdehyde synthase, mitochondrial-like n=1 Tax=Anopheles albimanus TaxID=7167 RepID=UPI001640ECDE|nr:alpha-aminoadipic semialdehyde synthase, mitochondrial-like [Anopheles albimanus]
MPSITLWYSCQHSDNPLRYKFSWSPRGVLLSTLSAAKYLNKGQVVKISGGGDLMSAPRELDFLPGFALEGFPNRDCTKYKSLYGLANINTLLRGTIRYKGFSDTIRPMQLLVLIDPNPHPLLHPHGPELTWRQLIVNLLGLADADIFIENLKYRLTERVGTIDGLEELDSVIFSRRDFPSVRELVSDNERDLIVLRHDVGIRWSEERGINFVTYGQPAAQGGHSAMAKTVGFPAAIVANGQLMLRKLPASFQ